MFGLAFATISLLHRHRGAELLAKKEDEREEEEEKRSRGDEARCDFGIVLILRIRKNTKKRK